MVGHCLAECHAPGIVEYEVERQLELDTTVEIDMDESRPEGVKINTNEGRSEDVSVDMDESEPEDIVINGPVQTQVVAEEG